MRLGWCDLEEGRIKATRAESQWIVAARPLCHLQYLTLYLSRLHDSTRATMGIALKAPRCELIRQRGSLTARALWVVVPLLLVATDLAGDVAGFFALLDLTSGAVSHNPTHGSFAPLAFQPSAMTNCANQRFLSRHRRIKKQRRYERLAATSQLSLCHATVIRTGNQNQTKPLVPHDFCSHELILGHLRYLLTDVPPQPNSPPDNVFRRIDRLVTLSKKRQCLASDSRNNPTYPTIPKSFHKVDLSLQQGLLSPLIPPSPFPWLWFRWIVDRDSGNLVNPFMRVTN
ncbi:putative uncharacterized protein ART2 [Glycine soja]